MRLGWIERESELTLVRQCELVGVSRATVYRARVDGPVDEDDLVLCTLIDEEYTQHPFYGSRRMVVILLRQGWLVNRKRVQRLMRVMGISLERGVTILATLGACRNVIPNAEFQRFIGELEVQVTEGRGIAAGFRDSPLIPVSVKQMIETGEQTGTLGRVMGRVADFYERDLTRQLNGMAKMAEPVMLLVMGVLVGTIVTSIILPIFKMSRAVH